MEGDTATRSFCGTIEYCGKQMNDDDDEEEEEEDDSRISRSGSGGRHRHAEFLWNHRVSR